MSVINLSKRILIKISGPDSISFLQGLITQDVNKLEQGEALFSAFLSPQGRFLADFFLVAEVLECSNASAECTERPVQDEQISNKVLECSSASAECTERPVQDEQFPVIHLDIHQKFAADLIKKLKIYKLRSQVEIEQIDDVQIFLSEQPLAGAAASFVDPRHEKLGYRNIFIADKYQGEVSPVEAYHKLRIEHEVPDGAYDLTIDRSFILEFAYEKLNAIDFDKGCYIGQEVITRTYRRGVIRKEFKKFALTGEYANLQAGDDIIKDGKKLGVLCFRQDEEGTALLKKKD